MTDHRQWYFGDVPCNYGHGCTLPKRCHYHMTIYPENPKVIVVFYDEHQSKIGDDE
jgi:hypothetical protein